MERVVQQSNLDSSDKATQIAILTVVIGHGSGGVAAEGHRLGGLFLPQLIEGCFDIVADRCGFETLMRLLIDIYKSEGRV